MRPIRPSPRRSDGVASANGRDPRAAPPITVIAEGTAIEGSVSVVGDLRVDGTVAGSLLEAEGCEIAARGTVTVRTARARRLVVHGRLSADEVVAHHVVVLADGQVDAHVVVAEAVDVAAGGGLSAQLEIGSAVPVSS